MRYTSAYRWYMTLSYLYTDKTTLIWPAPHSLGPYYGPITGGGGGGWCGMVGDQASQMTVFNGSLGPTAIKLVPEHKMWHVVKGCMSQVSRGGLCCIDLAPHHATHHQHTAVQVRWC